ncbi:MAG: hypothetical protein ACRDAX_06655 [Propionibacteriaceae bacterium]
MDEKHMALWCAVGLVLSTIPLWFIGNMINIENPKKKLDEFIVQRRAELERIVAEGTFNLGEGHLPSAQPRLQKLKNKPSGS